MNLKGILDINKTISKDLFKETNYPWEVLPYIKDYIITLGNNLDKDNYTEIEEHIWVGSNVEIDKLSTIIAPCIIDDNTIIRPGAYIRGNAIIGKNCVIGNSTEIKNSIIFDNCQLPHYNYVGDSILGYKSHMGAGSITSNVKSDKKLVIVKDGDEKIETGLKKFGAMLGDNVEVGCGSVLNPGTVIGRCCNIYPLSSVRGCVPANHIYKSKTEIAEKRS